jgi:hypothetical protein
MEIGQFEIVEGKSVTVGGMELRVTSFTATDSEYVVWGV